MISEATMTERIGFVGIGNMGLPMATNLLRAGFTVRAYNRTRARAASLEALGAEAASDIAAVAEPGGILITMISDDQALREISASGVMERLAPEGIHLSMSTVSPAAARNIARQHEAIAVHYVAAPVFGRPEAAAARKLWICVSGPKPARDRVAPVLGALGQGVYDFGEDPGAANVVKLAGNFLIGSALEAMAEAMTLVGKDGIERGRLLEVMGQTLFACPVYQNYGRALTEERYEPPGFRLALALKDINLVLGTAASSATPMPLASLLHDRMISGVAKGRSEMDWSVIGLGVMEGAGLR
jgi:3-hydroxyisobutyrate dehydrogenase-like beta-hydroxyacid dehydrogenase